MEYLYEYITEYKTTRPDYKDTIPLCIGILFGCGISMFTRFVLATRKLKWNNSLYKDGEKRIYIQRHQMSRTSATSATSAMQKNGYKNPFMRFITRFTGSGDGTGYQQFCFEDSGDEARGVSGKRPETAEVECQVCPEIISKRERRIGREVSDDGEATPREGYVQEMFGESVSTNTTGTQQQYTCAICLDEELGLGNTNTTKTECGHTFHLSCLLKSLNTKNLCPMCRAPLEDVRTKQLPANVLTPVSAEQMVAEEISYFSNAAHAQSITSSRHPKRCFKESLRVFGFTLLRNVAEYIHDENMPPGWYDDGESDSENTDDDNETNDDDNETNDDDNETNDGDNETNDDDNETNDDDNETNEENEDEDNEHDYEDYSTEDELQSRQGQIQGSQQQPNLAALRALSRVSGEVREARDLRELIGSAQ
jgi:hypothetical protein